MCPADDELLDSLMMYDMREICFMDRPMRGTRDYAVRVVLRLLPGDVQHKVYKFDFDKLSDEDEEEIYAVCDAVFDFIFLDTEYTPGDDEWNDMLAADKNVFKQGVLSEFVKAAVKAAIAFRSLKTGRHDYGCGFDYADPGMTEAECSGRRDQNGESDNFNSAHSLFPVQHFKNVMDGRHHHF